MQEFVTDDFWRAYTDRLIRAEVIAPVGYGKGLPVFLPWGLMIVRRLVELFREEFCYDSAAQFHVPSTLIDADRYDAEVTDFGGYDNIYRLEIDDKEFVVRPDAAVDNLSLALKSKKEDEDSTVLSVFQGFRRIKGPTPPLFRDRCIWPFVQLNRIVQLEERERAIADILTGLANFFRTLCLPSKIIHAGPWKNYARDLYDVVLITTAGMPTILAMFFIVGESYRRAASIPDNCEAFDVGLTEKTLSALLLSYPAKDGIVLPSRLAPVQVVIGSDTGQWPQALPREGVSFRFVPRSKKNWWKIWQHRGVPLLLDDSGQQIRFKSRLSTWANYESGMSLRERLQQHDKMMMSGTSDSTSEAERMFYLCCRECLPKDCLTGDVFPTEVGPCRLCLKPALLQFISPHTTIY
jgi:hypothetical protein